MSLDTRNNSALFKRAEQLKRWEESDTNREPTVPKNIHGRRIKFSSGCVFLAACMAGDKDEVLRLLEDGADIDTANVDGLTALHQACIDDNLEMVEFLVQQSSDINRPDNEGWTPLHATSSCGFISIAQYLIENNADLAAINSDGDLAIDLAANDGMEDLLQKHIEEQNIDCEDARQSEQRLMLNDAKKWLRSDATEADRPHPRTGATALHVASAKGYTKVLSLLLAGRADVDKQDNDGWTPLHAAAHWGQKEAAQMLVTALADMDIKNYAGQNPLDVAHPDIMRFLEDLRKNNKRRARKNAIQKITDNMDNHLETPPKVIRVEVKPDLKDGDDDKPKPPSEPAAPIPKDKNLLEDDAPWRRSGSLRSRTQPESPPKTQVPDKEVPVVDSDVILRRTQSFENDEKKTPGWPPVSPTAPVPAPSSANVRRSFVPPARDEESETQRKAHAKRVRETRRSTQGVTLDEIKSAEELVKKKNMNNNNNNTNFKLEDASHTTSPNISPSEPIVTVSTTTLNTPSNVSSIAQRRQNNITGNTTLSSAPRPVSAPVISQVSEVNDKLKNNTIVNNDITQLRRIKSSEDKENDKENDSRSAQATQAVIQRRRRPKRRSTGVVHLDKDDIDPDRQESPVDGDEKESGSEFSTRSRLGSTNSLADRHDDTSGPDSAENGEFLDYKALWEASKLENDKLKVQLKKKDDEIHTSKATLERFTNATTKNSLSEIEKRERRAMERKMSEMEEELKQLDALKTENQRLKDENGALIRVISKLSK